MYLFKRINRHYKSMSQLENEGHNKLETVQISLIREKLIIHMIQNTTPDLLCNLRCS